MRHHPSTITECPKPTDPRFQDLTGREFTRLTVIRFIGIDQTNNKYWECQCSCGQLKTVAGKHLNNQSIQSCGCLNQDIASARLKTHGESQYCDNTTEYRSYNAAKSRCQNINNEAYANYGGRGIEFRFESYEQFLGHLGRKPTPEHSLDRFPNNKTGHYEIGNVRWATSFEQAQNQRKNIYLTDGNETHCLLEWSRIIQVSDGTLRDRKKLGWCDHCILTIRPRMGTCSHKHQLR